MTDITPRFGATGVGVSDLRRSTDFYKEVFGMTVVTKFKLPDMEEMILSFPSGAALVLMCHIDGSKHDLANTGGKLVFYVADPVATAQLARDHGAEVVREPTPIPEFNNTVVGFVKDPDGHLLELLQA